MNRSATITSKMQFTIPIIIAKSVGIKSGQKVNVTVQEGQIIITPLKKLVENMAGSIKIPKQLQGQDIDKAIKQAKLNYFKSKHNQKKKI